MKLFLALLIAFEVKTVNPQVEVKTQVTKAETYNIITRSNPLKFEVTGPTWIRVFTRLPWKPEFKGIQSYKMILVTDGSREKFITRETELSKTARVGNQKVSKWRSFYVFVPDGKHSYELYLWRSPVDTIFVKLSYEAPGRYIDVVPLEFQNVVELSENERVIKYYEVVPQKPMILELEGPTRVKIIARTGLRSLEGRSTFTLSIKSKGKKLKEVTLSSSPSDLVRFLYRKDIIPSEPRVFYLSLGKGKHRLEIDVVGVESALLRLQVPEK